MPARDSCGDAGDGADREGTAGGVTSGDEEAADPRDESIEVADPGELGEATIQADPVDETEDYLVQVAEMSVADPIVAGDEIGTLLSIAREYESDHREDADLILEHLGDVRPAEFEVWTEDLRSLAESANEELAFVGLRSFAQLATVNTEAARAGLDSATKAVRSGGTRVRRAGLALFAEVGSDDPAAVRHADGSIAAAIQGDDPAVRVAGAVAAGRLLAADPSPFPRTATALPDALDDEHERVRQYAHVALANFALEHPVAVPEKERAIEALADVTDRELGLREGATDEALSTLLEFVTLQ